MIDNRWTVPIGQQVDKQKKKSCLASFGDSFRRFNPCLRPEKQSKQLTDLLHEFKQVSLYHDPYFGQVFLLQSLAYNKQILLKKQKVSPEDGEKRLNKIRQLSNFNVNPHIVSQTLIAEIDKQQFIWPKKQLYIAYDFLVFDLQKQFQYRISKGAKFSQKEIMSIIRGACKGYISLESTDYASVRMSYIYFTRKGFVKVAHPDLFMYKSNLSDICEHNSRKGIYLSPEQMYCLEKGQKGAILGWKSNCFVFGMVLLSLMSQSHLNEIYDYSGCFIDRIKVDQLLRNCKQNYPQKLVNIVEKLIQQRPQQRITMRNLLNKVSNTVELNPEVDLQLLNSNARPIEVVPNLNLPYSQNQRHQPQHVNYIAGLLYPKIGTTGEFFNENKIDNSRISVGRKGIDDNSVIAEQRHFYANRNSYYIGNATNGISSLSNSQMPNRNTSFDQVAEKPIRQGKGYYMNQDGQYFVGNWSKGQMTGYGKLYWTENKIRYEGDFLNGKFHGKGTQFNGDPRIVGYCEPGDEPDPSFVRMQRNNWLKYEGSFVNDLRQGQGIAYFKTGRWMGNFKNGQPNGQGVFIDNMENKTKGVWHDGVRA